MENTINRRASKGRSSILENSINTFEVIIHSSNIEDELFGLVINNTLPSELRSIAWRLFLDILPKNNKLNEWIKKTKENRLTYENLYADKEVEHFIKVITKEADISTLSPGSLYDGFLEAQAELKKIAGSYDFFKSEIVGETLMRLYILWRKNNPHYKNTLQPFYILASVLYSLYPSIVHIEVPEITTDDPNSRETFYYLNDEEYFDADAYVIFNAIMTQGNLHDLISGPESLHRHQLDKITSEVLEIKDFTGNKLILDLNRYERVAYFYLAFLNANLLKHLLAIKLDPYDVVQRWINSLFTSSLQFEDLTYFWDNIIMDKFGLVDFLCVALINNLANELTQGDLVKNEEILNKYPENKVDQKEIIKKAMKLRERIADLN